MTHEFRIEIEQPSLLDARQELAVLRAARRRDPNSPLLRAKLATALLVADEFDDLIEMLGECTIDPEEGGVLVQAHLARETETDDLRAIEICDRLMPLLEADDARAQTLADRAKALRRLNRSEAARAELDHALALDPSNKDACKRLAALLLDDGDAVGALRAMDRAAERGASHARLHAARAVAEARVGLIADARGTIGLDEFRHVGMLPPPLGFDDVGAFNDALAAELLANPSLRFDRYGTASQSTWRIDAPLAGNAPMTRRLLDGVARVAERHVASLRGSDHPWMRSRPTGGRLHCWCVMTDGAGYETWHVHQFGWMSGVYYVRVPSDVAQGDDEAGCIAFGLPEELAGDDGAAGYGVEFVRPQEGMVMLFPSHCYHRTFPHGGAERRICVAFDVWPT